MFSLVVAAQLIGGFMSTRQQLVRRNILLFSIGSFLSNFRLNAPILIIYFQQQTGSLTAAMSLGASLMIGASLLDIPTGALADIFGRKTLLVLSWICGFVHLTLLAIGGSYGMLLAGMLVGSAGMALGSGADAAMLYDSLVELGREHDYQKISGRANGLLTLALGVAAPLGSVLASISLALPFWAQLLPQALGLLLVLLMVEPAYHKPQQKNLLLHTWRSTRNIMKNGRVVVIMLMSASFYAIGENIAALMPEWYTLNISLPLVGVAFTATYLLSAAGFFLSDAVSRRMGNLIALTLATIYPVVGMVVATLLAGPLAVLCVVSTSFLSGVRWPLLDFLLQQQIEANQRATISSFQGVLQRGLFALIALLLGMLADAFGVVQGIRWAALLLLVNIVGVWLLWRRKSENI
jgi:MFS family permease